jgi:hypothetical protein
MLKITIATAIGLLGLSIGAQAAPPLFRVTDLGRVPHSHAMTIADLSESGDVIGTGYRSGQNFVDWLWTPARGFELDPHPQVGYGHSERPLQFDEDGGLYFSRSEPRRSGIPPEIVHRRKDGSMVTLAAAHPILNAANAGGTSIGTDYDTSMHAVSWNEAGEMTDLQPSHYRTSQGQDINASGRMLINANGPDFPGAIAQPFVKIPGGGSVKLGVLDDSLGGFGSAINAAGAVAGSSKIDSTTSVPVAWLDDAVPTVLTDGTPYAGYAGEALRIDDRGEVIGQVVKLPAEHVVFWWSAAEGMHDLRALVDPADPFFGRIAPIYGSDLRMNGKGQIAFTSQVEGRGLHAFLMTPEE